MGSVAASVGGSLVSGYFANKAAKKQAGAIDRANQMNNMGYTDARPFINAGYQGGQDALNKMLSTGAYQGDLYANMNDMQTTGLNNQFNSNCAMLFVCEIRPGVLISHDGYIQLGIHSMSIERFLELQKVPYQVTYWIPDIFARRYPRRDLQQHQKVTDGKSSVEGCDSLNGK